MEREKKKKLEMDPWNCEHCPVTSRPIRRKPEWTGVRVAGDDYVVSVAVVGDDILLVRKEGYSTRERVEKTFEFLKKVVPEVFLETGRYAIIEDYRAFKGSSLDARKLYIKTMKKYLIIRGGAFFGASSLIQMSIRIGHCVARPPWPVGVFTDYRAAILFVSKIKSSSEKKDGREKGADAPRSQNLYVDVHPGDNDGFKGYRPESEGVKKIVTEEELQTRINEILQFMGTINWGADGLESQIDNITSPWKEIYESLSQIKMDFDRIMKEKEMAMEDMIASEERFRVVFENSHDLMSMTDLSENAIQVNSRWQETLGYSPKNESEPFERIHRDDAPRVRPGWEAVRHGSVPVNGLEYRTRAADGSYVYLETTANRVKTPDGDFLFLVSHDISSRKKAEREREEMQGQMFLANKMASIGELAAGVGHEINNPNAIIQGSVEIARTRLQDGSLSGERAESIFSKIGKASERINNIARGLSVYTRSGKKHFENTDCHKLIEEALALLGKIYEKEGVTIEIKLDAACPVISANVEELQQIIVNLFSNARDALEGKSERQIKIETANEGDSLIIKISDTGCGIEKKNIERLFDAFYTSKEVGKGTGLGLSTVRTFVDDMKGKINVESEIAKGSTFILTFPTVSEAGTKIAKQATVVGKLSGRVLVVDDEEPIRDILKNFLGRTGLEVEVCGCGEDAISILKESAFDFLITDLIMPGISGKELIEEVRKMDCRGMKIIILTGNMGTAEDGEKDIGYSEVVGYLQKPFSSSQVYEILSRAEKQDLKDVTST